MQNIPLELVHPTHDEIHLWLIDLNPSVSRDPYVEDLLSDEERHKAQCFKFTQHRQHFVTSHGYLRLILSRYLNCAPPDVAYVSGKRGKPYLLNQDNHLFFNMSHTEGKALYAITLGAEIGVDIEKIHETLAISELIEQVFTPQEKSYFEKCSDNQKRKFFYDIWTQKEAYLKATGDGLTIPLNTLDISRHKHAWASYKLDISGYAAAIAVGREQNTLRYMNQTLRDQGLEREIYQDVSTDSLRESKSSNNSK